jgi:hypothetical protein
MISINLVVRLYRQAIDVGGTVSALIVAIGIFAVAFLSNESPPSQIHLADAIWSVLVSLLISTVAIALWFTSRVFSIRISRLVLPLYITFVFYGHIQGIADDLITFDFVRDRLFYSDRLFAPLSIIATVLIYYGVSRVTILNATVTRYATVLFILLAVWNFGGWVIGQNQSYDFSAERVTTGVVLEQPEELFPIYLMMFDGYARDDVLSDLYQFDNTRFLDGLETRGFSINHNANTNFHATGHVIPSLIELENMGLLDEESAVSLTNDRTPTHWRFDESAIATLLSNIGYESVELSSNKPLSLMGSVFPVAYYESTGLRGLPPRYQPWRGSMVLGMVVNLNATGQTALKQNSLVFSYNLQPHPPYLFDSSGGLAGARLLQPIEKTRREDWKDVDGYVGQLEFVNSEITSTVDEILLNSSVDPLIIIVSDHGTASQWNNGRLSSTPNEALFNERIGILSAIHVPAVCDSSEFDKSDALMNTFNMVLNACFQAELPLQQNDVYWGVIGSFDHYIDAVWVE